MKTGDLGFVKANFATEGPAGAAEPSIEDTAHAIAADRTGPGGIMESTDDIDTNGYWTVDDYEALMGLAAYRYLAERLGDTTEVVGPRAEYNALLAATNRTLDATIARYHLHYLPCSMLEPNTANRCSNPEDANWAAPFQFGRWAWDAQLFGATVDGPGPHPHRRHLRLRVRPSPREAAAEHLRRLPRLTTTRPATTPATAAGDWPASDHRDQGILSYEFMIANDQSGPYSWWESSSAPSTTTPWIGRHPAAGQGSSPHAWGISEANKVLLDSLVAERSDGTLIVGRGVPAQWLRRDGPSRSPTSPPPTARGSTCQISSSGQSVTLTVRGQALSGSVLFQLPSFVDNVARTSSGLIDEKTGTVTISPRTRRVTVHFRVAPR